MLSNLLVRIDLSRKDFSKGQRKIADYIEEHYDTAAFMTAAKLGEVVGVSESTVVRFATQIGYDGFPYLQKAMQEMIRDKLNSIQRIEVTTGRIGDADVVESVLNQDIDKIRRTIDEVSREDFKKSVSAIINARNIYVLGVRSSAPLASYLSYYLNLFFTNVHLVLTNSISETFEQILNIGKDDVMIGISFPRYSKRTVKAMQYAHVCGASVIALTDNDQSPIAATADCVLKAYSNMISFVDSLVGPMSLVNALIVALSMEKQGEVERNLATLENIWKEYDVYEKTGEEDDTFGKLLS